MSFYNYNPFFPKDIRAIEGADLKVLKDVSEGWYVDYKESIIEIKKLSKHLSSFSNQYGGWLFIGIKESETRKAGSFFGVDSELVESHLLRIREASSAHINPSVYYEEKVIYGPIEEISLEEGSAIIIIYIPEGANPPYIDSSGRIYRRLADQSHPVSETDRHILDKLWEKGKNRRDKIKEFISKRPKCNFPVIHIHFMTNPLGEKYFNLIDYEEFRDIFSGLSAEEGLSMPMDSIHSVNGGFIAKQTKGNDKLNTVTTFRWWHNGNSSIVIPLNTINYDTINSGNINYTFVADFLAELHHQNLGGAQVCDFSYFIIVLACLYNQLTKLLRKTENHEIIRASVTLENAKNMIPFIDDGEYVNQVRDIGASLIEDKIVTIPEDIDHSGLISLSPYTGHEKEGVDRAMDSIVNVIPIFSNLLHSVGATNNPKDIAKFTGLYSTSRFGKNA